MSTNAILNIICLIILFNRMCYRYGRGNLIAWLVRNGADVNIREREHGYTSLSLALVLGDEWCARELLLAGADLSIPAFNSRTAIFLAAEKGLTEFLRLAVEKYHVDVNTPVRAPYLMYLIHFAVVHRRIHFVSELIKYGADLNVLDEMHVYTPLSMAIVSGCTTVALMLIRAGAELRIPCKFHRLPMLVTSISFSHITYL
jgi:ankyrin repeat protein